LLDDDDDDGGTNVQRSGHAEEEEEDDDNDGFARAIALLESGGAPGAKPAASRSFVDLLDSDDEGRGDREMGGGGGAARNRGSHFTTPAAVARAPEARPSPVSAGRPTSSGASATQSSMTDAELMQMLMALEARDQAVSSPGTSSSGRTDPSPLRLPAAPSRALPVGCGASNVAGGGRPKAASTPVGILPFVAAKSSAAMARPPVPPSLMREIPDSGEPEDPELPQPNREALRSWIYPVNKPPRAYQRAISEQALYRNTLVCLPTGLGKTFIAAVVMLNYYRWFPTGKIVFMAPTRPLAAQQMQAVREITGFPLQEIIEMTGELAPELRHAQWQAKRVFFLTPQALHNDLTRGTCPIKDIVCLVVDEAHKYVG
jgi:hypothetical protein